MKILEDIISSLEINVAIEEIIRGPLWTGVISRRCGLASAMYEGSCDSAAGKETRDPGKYIEMTADELAALSLSDRIPEASLGMAAINSLIGPEPEECEEVNASEFLMRAGRGKNVSIIGHFPFVDEIRDIAENLWVIEKKLQDGDYPEEDSARYLPLSDVIAISSTTLINHTLSSLLKLCPAASIKILLGPTTPISRILFDYGIDIVSGSHVTDTALVCENIRRGISFSAMKKIGGIQLLSLVRDREKYKNIMSA